MQTSPYVQAPRLPGSPPRGRGFLNKNQQSEQETTTVADFWVHFWVLFLESIIPESISAKLHIFDEIWDKKRIVIADLSKLQQQLLISESISESFS